MTLKVDEFAENIYYYLLDVSRGRLVVGFDGWLLPSGLTFPIVNVVHLMNANIYANDW